MTLKCKLNCAFFNVPFDSLGIAVLFYCECAAIRVPIVCSERKAVSDELRRHRSKTQFLQGDFDGQWRLACNHRRVTKHCMCRGHENMCAHGQAVTLNFLSGPFGYILCIITTSHFPSETIFCTFMSSTLLSLPSFLCPLIPPFLAFAIARCIFSRSSIFLFRSR